MWTVTSQAAPKNSPSLWSGSCPPRVSAAGVWQWWPRSWRSRNPCQDTHTEHGRLFMWIHIHALSIYITQNSHRDIQAHTWVIQMHVVDLCRVNMINIFFFFLHRLLTWRLIPPRDDQEDGPLRTRSIHQTKTEEKGRWGRLKRCDMI